MEFFRNIHQAEELPPNLIHSHFSYSPQPDTTCINITTLSELSFSDTSSFVDFWLSMHVLVFSLFFPSLYSHNLKNSNMLPHRLTETLSVSVWAYCFWPLIKFPGSVYVVSRSQLGISRLTKSIKSIWSALSGILLQTDTNTPCKQALPVMSLNRCTHVIIYSPPFVLSFATDPLTHFFQHPICLTVLLSGLKVRSSQLIPLISAGPAIKARDTRMTALKAFSEGCFEISDASEIFKASNQGSSIDF